MCSGIVTGDKRLDQKADYSPESSVKGKREARLPHILMV
jgi:hypothetical protein